MRPQVRLGISPNASKPAWVARAITGVRPARHDGIRRRKWAVDGI